LQEAVNRAKKATFVARLATAGERRDADGFGIATCAR
jgi:hypothetical protein